MRHIRKISIDSTSLLKKQLLQWGSTHEVVMWLDSNDYSQDFSSYDAILAVNVESQLTSDYFRAFEELKTFQAQIKDWIFGYFSYDLKNDVEQLQSRNNDDLLFPDLFFFQPKKIFLIKDNSIELQYASSCSSEMDFDLKSIQSFDLSVNQTNRRSVSVQARMTKLDYINRVNQIKEHILRGDIYEANFCQEFYAHVSDLDPLLIFKQLNEMAKVPFATFFKRGDNYLISSSPERYLRKEGKLLISEPIKGTAKRSADIVEDSQLSRLLQTNKKERSENIMIVDLVRNDLSKVAKPGTVQVQNLCKVHAFEQVHQMISTITATMRDDVHPVDAIRASFPMGSMTGAPKVSAMTIIENFEISKRGLYSGAIGYFTPELDFDFNVVIRSILYNKNRSYLSYSVGSAITNQSDAEYEYEECLLKARALRSVLEK